MGHVVVVCSTSSRELNLKQVVSGTLEGLLYSLFMFLPTDIVTCELKVIISFRSSFDGEM